MARQHWSFYYFKKLHLVDVLGDFYSLFRPFNGWLVCFLHLSKDFSFLQEKNIPIAALCRVKIDRNIFFFAIIIYVPTGIVVFFRFHSFRNFRVFKIFRATFCPSLFPSTQEIV